MKRHLAGIWKTKNGLLRLIAGSTRVQQISVFALTIRIRRNRNEVIDMERRPAAAPLLAMKTVNATEGELIAKPISKTAILLVAHGAMTPDVRQVWILKSDHETSPFFFGIPENSLFSSSSSTSVGRGDTWSRW